MTPDIIDTIPQAAKLEHAHAGGSSGEPGECSAWCTCGVEFAGCDTYHQASDLLDRHIERQGGTPVEQPTDAPAAPTAEEIAAQKRAEERAEYIAGLEQIAAFLREHPEAPLPSIGGYPYAGAGYVPTLHAYAELQHGDPRDSKRIMSDTARALGNAGKGIGIGADPDFMLYRKFAGIWYALSAPRAEVCERIVTGTREVTKTVRDPEALAAVPLVEVTETVEEVRWECRPVLDGDR